MSDREIIYKLLFDALLELRIEGHESKNAKVFRLADLFQQLPNRLRDMQQGKIEESQILEELRQRARERGVEQWLDLHLPQLVGDQSD
ncbi:MAG TPA: hypothetical protein VLI90_14010 [Tepidisphaeraceae bacterium]|nr:hypothetical protein [Tepidisphaeraceae bacterium]